MQGNKVYIFALAVDTKWTARLFYEPHSDSCTFSFPLQKSVQNSKFINQCRTVNWCIFGRPSIIAQVKSKTKNITKVYFEKFAKHDKKS